MNMQETKHRELTTLINVLSSKGFTPFSTLPADSEVHGWYTGNIELIANAKAFVDGWMDLNLHPTMCEEIAEEVSSAAIFYEELMYSMEDVHPLQAQQDFERRCAMDEQSAKHFNNYAPY